MCMCAVIGAVDIHIVRVHIIMCRDHTWPTITQQGSQHHYLAIVDAGARDKVGTNVNDILKNNVMAIYCYFVG